MKLANKSRTPLAGEQLQLSAGDEVEIFRKPPNKDRPGWVGPAKVTDATDIITRKTTLPSRTRGVGFAADVNAQWPF